MQKTLRRKAKDADRRGVERMHHVVMQVYCLNDHDSDTFHLLADLEAVLEGGEPVQGEIVRRYGELMKSLDEK